MLTTWQRSKAGAPWSRTGLERLKIASSRTLSLDLEQARSRLALLAGLSVLRSTTSCSELKRTWAPMPSLQEQTSARECKRAAVVPLLGFSNSYAFPSSTQSDSSAIMFCRISTCVLEHCQCGHVISVLSSSSIAFKSLDAVHL